MIAECRGGIIFVNRNGLRWRDALAIHGPDKTLYYRWRRWSEAGVFRITQGLSGGKAERRRDDQRDLSQSAPHGFEPRGLKKRGSREADRMHPGQHQNQAARRDDANGRPISVFMTAGQVSDHTGAAALLVGPRRSGCWATGAIRRLVQGRPAGQWHHALDLWPQIPDRARPLQQTPVREPKPRRDLVR